MTSLTSLSYPYGVSVAFSIYETKAKLSAILKRVKSGENIVVTERGKPIAKITSYQESPDTLAERLEQLRACGQVFGGGPFRPFPVFARTAGALKRFLKDR